MDRRRRACNHVEKMIDEMRGTNLNTWEHCERFVVYVYVTGSNDSGTEQLKRAVASTQRVNRRCFIESVVLFELSAVLNCML